MPAAEPASQEGFTRIGEGACRDANMHYPAWSSWEGEHSTCAEKCSKAAECDAFMSTGVEEYCQFFCVQGKNEGLCTEDGNGGKMLTTADGTRSASGHERVCWLKQK